ncbi:MAG: carbamate kinase [Lachnospiraceae bacterium]|jgi:carbamate kinase|nr:carbamate kinase [Lachnospiraceae bacterium]RKJ51192.1 carbamate kinase [bacterium 1XD42-54]
MKKKVVVALGHKALGTTFPEQQSALKASVPILADLIEEGAQLIITHSNAPQVGMIHTAMNEFAKFHDTYGAPMSVCSAMSQGYIGYDIQNALRCELLKRGIYKTVATVLTQVTVDPYDEAFYHPIKVIGRYLTAEEAAAEEKKGNYVIEEPGKGFRRIVASPKPLDIVEIDAINALVDAGHIVIAGGGGGIPVLKQGSNLKGASAVIEKDLVSGRLADLTDADILMLLTNDEFVCLHHDSEHPIPLQNITPGEALKHIENKEFGKNKMLPKVEAAVHFVSQKNGRKAIITSADHAKDAYLGKTGTVIS